MACLAIASSYKNYSLIWACCEETGLRFHYSGHRLLQRIAGTTVPVPLTLWAKPWLHGSLARVLIQQATSLSGPYEMCQPVEAFVVGWGEFEWRLREVSADGCHHIVTFQLLFTPWWAVGFGDDGDVEPFMGHLCQWPGVTLQRPNR